jgi:hypothetical protein
MSASCNSASQRLSSMIQCHAKMRGDDGVVLTKYTHK